MVGNKGTLKAIDPVSPNGQYAESLRDLKIGDGELAGFDALDEETRSRCFLMGYNFSFEKNKLSEESPAIYFKPSKTVPNKRDGYEKWYFNTYGPAFKLYRPSGPKGKISASSRLDAQTMMKLSPNYEKASGDTEVWAGRAYAGIEGVISGLNKDMNIYSWGEKINGMEFYAVLLDMSRIGNNALGNSGIDLGKKLEKVLMGPRH